MRAAILNRVRFEREMAGVEQMHRSIGIVAAKASAKQGRTLGSASLAIEESDFSYGNAAQRGCGPDKRGVVDGHGSSP